MDSRRAAPRRTLPANPQRSTRSSSRVSAAAPPLRAGRASSFVRSSRLGSAETDDESAGRAPPERYALVPSSRTRVSHVLRRAQPEEVEEEEEEEYAQEEAAYGMEPQDDYDGMSEQDRTAVPRYSTARQRQSSSRTGGATSFAENAASSPPAVSPRKRPAGRAQTSRLSESVRPASRNAYSARVAQELLRPRMSAIDDARRPDAAFEAPAARRPRVTMPSRERNRLSSEQDRSLPRPTQTTQSASFATAVERVRGGRSSGAGNVSGRAPSGRGDISGNQSVVSFAPDSSYVRRRSQLAASEGRSTSRSTSVAGAPRLRRSLVGDDGQIHEPSLAERCGALETNASKLLSFYAGLVQDGAKSGSVAEMRRCWDPFHSYKTNQLLAEGQYHNHFIDASAVRSASLLEDPPEYFDRSLALANRATFVHYVYGVPANASSADLGTGGYMHRSLTELLDARRVFLAWIVPADVAISDDVLALHLDLCTQVYLARRRADRALPRAARKRAFEHRDDSLSAEAVRAALLRARVARQMRSAEVEEIVGRFEQLARARVCQIESLDDDVELMAEEWPLRGTAVDMARFVGYLDAPGQPPACSSSLVGLLDDLARMSADGQDLSDEVAGTDDLQSGSGSVLIDDEEEASAALARQSTPRGFAVGAPVESDLEAEEDVMSEAAESVFKDAETGSPAASSQQDLDSVDLQKLDWLDELAQQDGANAEAPAKRQRVAAPASKPLAVPIAGNSQLSSLLDLTASQKLQQLNGLALDDTAVIFGSSVADLTPRASIALTAQKVIQQMGEDDAAAGSPAAVRASLAVLNTPQRQNASSIMAQLKASASRRSIGADAAVHERVATHDGSDGEEQLVNGVEQAAAGSPAARLRFDSQKRIVRTNEPAAASILAAGKGTGVRLERFDEDDEDGNIFLEAPRKQAKTAAAARSKSKAAAAGNQAESEVDAQSAAGRTRRTTRAQSSRQASANPGTPRRRAQARGQASASKSRGYAQEDAAFLDQPEMPAFDEMPEVELEEERGRNDGVEAPFVDEVDENLPPPNGQRSFRRSGVRRSQSPAADFEVDEEDLVDVNTLLSQSRKRRRAGQLNIPAPRGAAARSQSRAAGQPSDLLDVSSDGSSEGEYVVEELGPRPRGRGSALERRRKRRGYDAPGSKNASVPVIADEANEDDQVDEGAGAAPPASAAAPRKSTRGELIGSGAAPATRTRARAAQAPAAPAEPEGDAEQPDEAQEPPPSNDDRRSASRIVSKAPASRGRPATQTRKIVRPNKNARKYVIGKGHIGRRTWTDLEEEVFMDALNALYKHKKKNASYAIYAEILKLHGPDGSESEELANWNNVQLKDKARNILIRLQSDGLSTPDWGKYLHPTLWEPKPEVPRSRRERTHDPQASGSEEEDEDEITGASDEEYTPRRTGRNAPKRSQPDAADDEERASAAPAGGADGAADDNNVDAGAESDSSVAAVESQIPSTAG